MWTGIRDVIISQTVGDNVKAAWHLHSSSWGKKPYMCKWVVGLFFPSWYVITMSKLLSEQHFPDSMPVHAGVPPRLIRPVPAWWRQLCYIQIVHQVMWQIEACRCIYAVEKNRWCIGTPTALWWRDHNWDWETYFPICTILVILVHPIKMLWR